MSDIAKIIEKVAHLRALAARAGTPAEAEAAASAAAELMQRYRLAEADVEARGEKVGEGFEHSDTELFDFGARAENWVVLLGVAVSKHFGCYVCEELSRGGGQRRSSKLRIIGRRTDIELTRYLFAWVRLEILRLCKREHGRTARVAFCRGAVQGVERALERAKVAARAGHVAAGGSSTALVTVDTAEQAKAFARQALGSNWATKKIGSPVSKSEHIEPFLRGRKKGEAMNVDGAALPVAPTRALPQGSR